MTITLGPLNFTAHRGEIIKNNQHRRLIGAATSQAKDAYEADPKVLSILKPRTSEKQGPLPRLAITRTTPFTRLTSVRQLEQTRSAIPIAGNTPDEIRDAVRARARTALHAQDHLPVEARRKVLFLVGGNHLSTPSLVMDLSVVSAVRDSNATVLLEHLSTHVDDIKQKAAGLAAALRRRPTMTVAVLDQVLSNPESADFENASAHLTALAAAHAGADVGHFDPLWDGHKVLSPRGVPCDQDDRESEMVSTIKTAMACATGPVVVLAGAQHIPILREELKDGYETCTFYYAGPFEKPEVSARRKRYSYLLTSEDVFRVKPGPRVERQFVPHRFVRDLGISLKKAPARAFEFSSPWERASTSEATSSRT
jgi:hypothetical protein